MFQRVIFCVMSRHFLIIVTARVKENYFCFLIVQVYTNDMSNIDLRFHSLRSAPSLVVKKEYFILELPISRALGTIKYNVKCR